MINPSEEEYLASWRSVLEKYGDIDDSLPVYAWPGGGTLVYIVGDDHNLGEICPTCAQEVAKHPKEYSSEQFIFRALETYDEGEPIHCAHCDRVMLASYGETEERSH